MGRLASRPQQVLDKPLTEIRLTSLTGAEKRSFLWSNYSWKKADVSSIIFHSTRYKLHMLISLLIICSFDVNRMCHDDTYDSNYL